MKHLCHKQGKKSKFSTEEPQKPEKCLWAGFEMHATRHKRPFVPAVGGYQITMVCMDRLPSHFGEMSAKVTNAVTDSPTLFCDSL